METALNIFMYLHIRMAKRKMFGIEARFWISILFILILCGLLLALAFIVRDIFSFLQIILAISLDMAIMYFWLMSSSQADVYLENSKNSEIISTRYKLKEF